MERIFTEGVAAILYDPNGKVLLNHCDGNTPYFKNTWSLFTGSIELDKDWVGGPNSFERTLDNAVRREVGEELILDDGTPFCPVNFTYLGSDHFYDDMQECTTHIFAAVIEIPFDRLRYAEGDGIGKFTKRSINEMTLAANYKRIVLDFFGNGELLSLVSKGM